MNALANGHLFFAPILQRLEIFYRATILRSDVGIACNRSVQNNLFYFTSAELNDMPFKNHYFQACGSMLNANFSFYNG